MAAQSRDEFAYWDGNGNGDLTCSEAVDRDEGLRLPAYKDNRDGTGIIYEWLERQRSSDTDNDGIACDSSSNPRGYIPKADTMDPQPTGCPPDAETWRGLKVCAERSREGYDRDDYGSGYSRLEDDIIAALPATMKKSGQVYTPYSCIAFDIRADGTAATDIEHIVALAEAHDSGIVNERRRDIASDLDNLTIADPTVNRSEKSDRDAAEWMPDRHGAWFAARVIAVKREYELSVDPAERDALEALLAGADSELNCVGTTEPTPMPKLNFAHFANGGGITSDVVVVNASANAVRPNIYFYDTMGELIDAASVVDVMGQGLEVTSYGALTVPNAIPPLGEVTIPTHGMGDLMTGSVKVVSDSSGSAIGGVLRFDLTDVGVAGVGASPTVRDAIFPARRVAGGINTGAAFRNLSEANQILTCRLMKDGQHLGDDAMVDLPANGQTAKFINEMFDHDTSDFTGSVRCTSPEGEQEFTAVALELDTNNGIFTTLPVVPVVMDGSGSGNKNGVTLYFAHFANGGGITSDIVVVNAAGTAVRPDIYFYDTMGELIDAGSVLDVMGEGLEVTGNGALTVPNPIPPLGEVTIPTHGMGDLMTGSVKVASDSSVSAIGGVLRFDLTGVGVAGVGSSQPVQDAIFPARRVAGGINTGAAFRNLSDSSQILTCRLMKDGQQLGDDAMVDLPANGQTAKFINEMFDHDTSDFTGSVRCTSPAGEQEFTAVALELDTNNGVFTTLPVVPVR